MAKKYLSAIRQEVRQMLLDEFAGSGEEYEWEDDELDGHIQQTLNEISLACPYEDVETLTTTADSRALDISDIENFIELAPEHEIEFPVDEEPPIYHNASIFGDTLRMDIGSLPEADEEVYVYCHKFHSLTEDSSTLQPKIEPVLTLGSAAYAAVAKAQSKIKKINVAGSRVAADMQDWGNAKLVLYYVALRKITKIKTHQQYVA